MLLLCCLRVVNSSQEGPSLLTDLSLSQKEEMKLCGQAAQSDFKEKVNGKTESEAFWICGVNAQRRAERGEGLEGNNKEL